MNLIQIEIKAIQSELDNLNGGLPLQNNNKDYLKLDIFTDFDSLLTKLRDSDNNYLALISEKKLYEKKLNLAEARWLPNFDIGYRQESEAEIAYKGLRLQMSIPIFENTNKVPKAEAELSAIELKIQSYAIKFYLDKKRLFDKLEQLKKSYDEQISLVDFEQLELNKKSYELGNISLTQFYLDNTIYYDIIDAILEIELEYNQTLLEFILEINANI